MEDMQNKKLAIASRIATARKNAGLSQGQVARLLGMHRPSISEIEAGRRNVSAEELASFAKIYRVDISWLACEDNPTPNERRDRIELAARELAKLKDEDFQKVIDFLSIFR